MFQVIQNIAATVATLKLCIHGLYSFIMDLQADYFLQHRTITKIASNFASFVINTCHMLL